MPNEPPSADMPSAPPPAESQTDALLRELRRDSRMSGAAARVAAVVCVVLAAALLWDLPGALRPGRPAAYLLPVLLGLASVAFAGLFAVIGWSSRRVAQRLATLEDVRGVGPLAAHVIGIGSWPHGGARHTLLRLVRQMGPADLEALSPNERHCFAALLTSDELLHSGLLHGPDLKLAILELLEEHGDRRDVGAVRYLSYRGHDPEVHEAARRCLERLESRAKEADPTASLLRPVDAPSDEAALLRPAEPSSDTSPQALLRPAEEDR